MAATEHLRWVTEQHRGRDTITQSRLKKTTVNGSLYTKERERISKGASNTHAPENQGKTKAEKQVKHTENPTPMNSNIRAARTHILEIVAIVRAFNFPRARYWCTV